MRNMAAAHVAWALIAFNFIADALHVAGRRRLPAGCGGQVCNVCCLSPLSAFWKAHSISVDTHVPPKSKSQLSPENSTIIVVPGFALASNSQYKSRIEWCHVPVQRNITSRTTSNDKFAFAAFDWSTDHRAGRQNLYGLQNFPNAFRRGANIELCNVVKDAVKIVEYLGSNLNASHRRSQWLELLANGLFGLPPWDLAARYAFASSQDTVFPVESIPFHRSSAIS
jgi:hypothetical protein